MPIIILMPNLPENPSQDPIKELNRLIAIVEQGSAIEEDPFYKTAHSVADTSNNIIAFKDYFKAFGAKTVPKAILIADHSPLMEKIRKLNLHKAIPAVEAGLPYGVYYFDAKVKDLPHPVLHAIAGGTVEFMIGAMATRYNLAGAYQALTACEITAGLRKELKALYPASRSTRFAIDVAAAIGELYASVKQLAIIPAETQLLVTYNLWKFVLGNRHTISFFNQLDRGLYDTMPIYRDYSAVWDQLFSSRDNKAVEAQIHDDVGVPDGSNKWLQRPPMARNVASDFNVFDELFKQHELVKGRFGQYTGAKYFDLPQAAKLAEQIFKPDTTWEFWRRKLKECHAKFEYRGTLNNFAIKASIGRACEGFDSLPWESPNFGSPVGLMARYYELVQEGMQHLHNFINNRGYIGRINNKVAAVNAFHQQMDEVKLSQFNDDPAIYQQKYNALMTALDKAAASAAQLKKEVGRALEHHHEGEKKKIHDLVWCDEFRHWAVDVYEEYYCGQSCRAIDKFRSLMRIDHAGFNAAATRLNKGEVLSDGEMMKVLGYSLHQLKMGVSADDNVVQCLQQLWQHFGSLADLTVEQEQLFSLTAKGLSLLTISDWPADYRAMRVLAAFQDDITVKNPYLRSLLEYNDGNNALELRLLGNALLQEIMLSKRDDFFENKQILQLLEICGQQLSDGAMYIDALMVRYFNMQDWEQISALFNGRYADEEAMADAVLREKLFFALAQDAQNGQQLDVAKKLVRDACDTLGNNVLDASTELPLLYNFVLQLIEADQLTSDDINLLKRGFASCHDEKNAEFWFDQLRMACVSADQLNEVKVLLESWIDQHPKSSNKDFLRLRLVQAQFLSGHSEEASKTFSDIQQPALQDTVGVKKPIFGEFVFKESPGNVMAFSIYLKGLLDPSTEIDEVKIKDAFKLFSKCGLERLSDDELFIYHQYVSLFGQLGLLEDDIRLGDSEALQTRFKQSLDLFKKSFDIEANNNIVTNHLKHAKHTLVLLRLLADYVDGRNEASSISDAQILRYADNLKSLLDDKSFVAICQDFPQHKQTLQEINDELNLLKRFPNQRKAKFRMDGVETLQFLLPFTGESLDIPKAQLYRFDSGLEILSRYFQWQSSVPSRWNAAFLLAAGGLRVWRNKISIESLGIDAAEHSRILANRWRSNYLSAGITIVDIVNILYVARMSLLAKLNELEKLGLTNGDIAKQKLSLLGEISNLQRWSLVYQFGATASGYFASWEYEKRINKSPERLTLMGNETAYDLAKSLSFAISRNPYIAAQFYFVMTGNAIRFSGDLMARFGVMSALSATKVSLLQNPLVVKAVNAEISQKMLSLGTNSAGYVMPIMRSVGAQVEQLLLKVGFEKTAEGGLKMGSALASGLVKGANIALFLSIFYDVSSILGFSWESEELQNIADLIKDVKYDEAKARLDAFDESGFYYNFYRVRTGVADGIYGSLLGSDSQKMQAFRLNKIYILRELLAACIDLHEGGQDKAIDVLEKMLRLMSYHEIINHKSPESMAGKVYEFFTASHYDTYAEDGFAGPIVSISSSAYLNAKMSYCNADVCTLEPEDWLERIQKLEFDNDKVAEEVLGKFAYYFMNDFICRARGLLKQCDLAMNRYFNMQKSFTPQQQEVINKVNIIGSGVAMSRIQYAFLDFMRLACDLSSSCEERFHRINEILRKSQSHFVDDRYLNTITTLKDDAKLHLVDGAAKDFQKKQCDLSPLSLERAAALAQRVSSIKLAHYQRDSKMRDNIDKVSLNCLGQAIKAYEGLEDCQSSSKQCDKGLVVLEQLAEKLPVYADVNRDKFRNSLHSLYLNRFEVNHNNIRELCEQSAECITSLPELSDLINNFFRVFDQSPYANEVRKYAYSSNTYALNAQAKLFRSYRSDLFHPLDAEFTEYQRVRQSLIVVNKVDDKFYKKYQEGLQCTDELVAIHRGGVLSLENNYSCPEARDWFDIKRSLFFGNIADFVIRLMLDSLPVIFKIISYVPILKMLSVNTRKSTNYKRFDTFFTLLREIVLYRMSYHLSHYEKSGSDDRTVKSLGGVHLTWLGVSKIFKQHQAALRIMNLLFNWALTEGLDVRYGFNKNKLLKPLIVISSIMITYYVYDVMSQLFFDSYAEKNDSSQLKVILSLYMIVMQCVNLSSLLLHYQKHNFSDRRVSRWGGLWWHLYHLQNKLILKIIGFVFLYSSMSARFGEYSMAFNFYGPVREKCLSLLDKISTIAVSGNISSNFIVNWIPIVAIGEYLPTSITIMNVATGVCYLGLFHLFINLMFKVYKQVDFEGKCYKDLKLDFTKEADVNNRANRTVPVGLYAHSDFDQPFAGAVDTPIFPAGGDGNSYPTEHVVFSKFGDQVNMNATSDSSPGMNTGSFASFWSAIPKDFAGQNIALNAANKVTTRRTMAM